MSEMREWWANVYSHDGTAFLGALRGSRALIERDRSPYAECAVHVRLKPEGAPRRYAGAWQRALWENNADGMRRVAEWEADCEHRAQPYVQFSEESAS